MNVSLVKKNLFQNKCWTKRTLTNDFLCFLRTNDFLVHSIVLRDRKRKIGNNREKIWRLNEKLNLTLVIL